MKKINEMNTQELLATTTPEAELYIRKTINAKNKNDHNKLQKLFDENKFEAKSFADIQLNILDFDWQSPAMDRNWWWQLQSLPFLSWHVNSFILQTKEEQVRYFSYCLDAIHCWVEQAKQNSKSPLTWHDHATAFRVRNLTNWLLFCNANGLLLTSDTRTELLADLIVEHLEWLTDENNYSKHTNHGFDQAMIALTIASMFSRGDFEAYRQRNRERLMDEVAFAFTKEAVHKENSPGYQKMMLSRLYQLRSLATLSELEISQMGEQHIEKGENFLRAITLPNGYLPMIGDTRGGDKGLPYEANSELDIIDYSESGYVIIRGDVLGRNFHLIFKASHLSHYHRHDDDLSIHLYFDGKTLLGDAGLGSHNEKDNKRILLRSSCGHNVPYIANAKAIRKPEDLEGMLPRIGIHDTKIIGKSYCYGVEITREIDISKLAELGRLIIKDSAAKTHAQNFKVNFFSPEELRDVGGNIIIPSSGEHNSNIIPKSPTSVECRPAYFSEEFSVFSEAASCVFHTTDSSAGFLEFEINLITPKRVLHEISYRGFGPIKILEGGDWFFDEKYPGNVCHHIMSLRWIDEIKSLVEKSRIILDFIAHHNSQSRKSKYYLGPDADHTASIRLLALLTMLSCTSSNERVNRLLRGEIEKSIRSCLSVTYKQNNNHGLMVDKSVLLCLIEDEWIFERFHCEIRYILNRIKKQLDGIFDKEGYCREHSTSYQEYDLGVALEIIEVAEKCKGLGFDADIISLREKVEKITLASRKALGFLLKDDGTYITVGDSFSRPKLAILEKAFGSRSPHTALQPESMQHGIFYNQTLGVSVYRSHDTHIVLNGSWHSYVHKQNDDLSIFLRANGEDIIIDGGYSDIVPKNRVNTQSEALHSTIIPIGKPWKDKGAYAGGVSQLNKPILSRSGVTRLSGFHSRVVGLVLCREIIVEKENIEIIDSSCGECNLAHRFIFPHNFDIEKMSEGCLKISSTSNNLVIEGRAIEMKKSGYWVLSESNIISENKVTPCKVADFLSGGRAIIKIRLNHHG